MEDLFVQLDDLPDEILIIILKKMYKAEVLYSLLGVNKRLNKIVYDSIFTSRLSLLSWYPTSGSIYPVITPMLDRFCSKILPDIHDKIKWLNLESSSMERILLRTNYTNLNGLGLYNIKEETVRRFSIGKLSI
jgi:hypothetical protein